MDLSFEESSFSRSYCLDVQFTPKPKSPLSNTYLKTPDILRGASVRNWASALRPACGPHTGAPEAGRAAGEACNT